MINLIEKIKKIIDYDNSNVSFVSISNFILNNLELNYQNLSIYELAKKTNTSTSTITRYCKKLDLSGYKEFVAILSVKKNEDNNDNVSLSLDYDDLVSKFSDDFYNSFPELIHTNLWKFNEIKKSINRSSQRIFFFGLGGNSYLIKVISHMLTRAGYTIFFSSDKGQQLSLINKMSREDIAIIVSLSLHNNLFEKVNTITKEKFIKTIYITKNWKSILLNDVPQKFILKITNNEDKMIGRMSSEITTILFLKMIYISLLTDEKIKLIKDTDI